MIKHHKPVKPIKPVEPIQPEIIAQVVAEITPPEIAVCPPEETTNIVNPETKSQLGYVVMNSPLDTAIVTPENTDGVNNVIEQRCCQTCECGTHYDQNGLPLLDSSDTACVCSADLGVLPL